MALSLVEHRSVIVRNPLVVSPDTTVMDAIDLMNGAQVLSRPHDRQQLRSGCVVVVADGQVVGIFTDRDVVRLSANRIAALAENSLVIQQVMTQPVVTIAESALTDGWLAIELLQQHHLTHLPVLDDRGCLVGLVTAASLHQIHRSIALEPATTNQQLQQKLDECQQAEQENQRLKERFEFLLQASPAVIFTCAPVGDYAISFVSDNIRRLVGYAPAEFLADASFWSNHLHPEDAPRILATLPQLFERGDLSYEYRFLDRSGHYIWLEADLRLVRDAQGVPVEIVGYLADVSERQQAQQQLTERNHQLAVSNEELARATRLKDEFLANMSHELRTPLNAILGMSEALQEDIFGSINDRQRKSIQTIERSGTHLLEIINDILDIAKIESGQIELDCAPTAVAPLCQSSLAAIERQALYKRIQLEIKLPLNLPNLSIDRRRIRQVLLNLLNNAVKFTPEGGQITLEVSSPPPRQNHSAVASIEIAIIDTGIGIAPEHFHKLFQPFIQIDSALNRQYQGTGLGLALVKRIVELHGGEVGLTSKVGLGSCFTISLPCPAPVLCSPQQQTFQPKSRLELDDRAVSETSPLILLAEDNEASINTVSSYLSAKGYLLIVANDGQEAIELANSHLPDLILMDIQMPGMDGLEAIQRIRTYSQLTSVPIIALTALALSGDREKCLAAGANEYLTKPVKLKQLATTVQEFLAN